MSMTHASPRMASPAVFAILAAVVAAALTGSPASTAARQGRDVQWVAAWGAAPDSKGPSIAGSTVRQIVRTSIGGSRVRLRLSNLLRLGAGDASDRSSRDARGGSSDPSP